MPDQVSPPCSPPSPSASASRRERAARERRRADGVQVLHAALRPSSRAAISRASGSASAPSAPRADGGRAGDLRRGRRDLALGRAARLADRRLVRAARFLDESRLLDVGRSRARGGPRRRDGRAARRPAAPARPRGRGRPRCGPRARRARRAAGWKRSVFSSGTRSSEEHEQQRAACVGSGMISSPSLGGAATRGRRQRAAAERTVQTSAARSSARIASPSRFQIGRCEPGRPLARSCPGPRSTAECPGVPQRQAERSADSSEPGRALPARRAPPGSPARERDRDVGVRRVAAERDCFRVGRLRIQGEARGAAGPRILTKIDCVSRRRQTRKTSDQAADAAPPSGAAASSPAPRSSDGPRGCRPPRPTRLGVRTARRHPAAARTSTRSRATTLALDQAFDDEHVDLDVRVTSASGPISRCPRRSPRPAGWPSTRAAPQKREEPVEGGAGADHAGRPALRVLARESLRSRRPRIRSTRRLSSSAPT